MFFGSRLNRLATSIRRGISKYSVGSDNPGLVFDFIDNFYQKDKNQTVNFDGAITHARAGNATMTDGYGPELVTNGSFTDSIDGWSGAGWVWSSRGASYDSGSSVTVALSQDVAVEAGKTYIVTFTLIDVSGGTPSLMDGEQSLQSHSASGNYEYVYIADSSTFELGFKGGTAAFYVDNVSVREMPVLKWAPHNLFSYSEQFDNAFWGKTVVTVTPNTATAPDGTTTADKITPTTENNIHFVGNSFSYPVAGETYELCVFAKPAGYNFIKLFGANSGTSEAWFDISNGTKGTTGGTGFVSSSITDVGNGWYRCALKFINPDATARNTGYYPTPSNNVDSYAGDGTSGIHFWGAHLYKADLGGMVDNPDRGDSYVPTTSSAKYLPRIGHHVYNGSAWANEGLLAESESRTNLATHSDMSSATVIGSTRTADNAVSPDGTENAFTITASSTAPAYIRYSGLLTSGQSYAVSVYAKAGTHDIIRIANVSSSTSGQWFDLTNGTLLTSNGANNTATIQEVGNGWYRCTRYFDSVTTGSSDEIFIANSSADGATSAVSGSTFHLYGFQVENNATSSSLIPTSGSSATRAAETFTIPSANLPWPTPQYIGSELVTNGTFDTDTSDWTASNATLSVESGELKITSTGGNRPQANQTITTTAGKVYEISALARAASVAGNIEIEISGISSDDSARTANTQNTRIFHVFKATSSSHVLQVKIDDGSSSAGEVAYFDSVSVREINPLSVSIAMDGRMTRESVSDSVTAMPIRWSENGNNQIRIWHDSSIGNGIRWDFDQEAHNVIDQVSSGYIDPFGILVPFDIASRHGSTFVNGAIDGVALTANTTPTELPDLSATDLNLAYEYMGTIGTFRVWDKDLGDTGIVEATNPSLEPSLSLTFEGTGTNSFIVNDWSQ